MSVKPDDVGPLAWTYRPVMFVVGDRNGATIQLTPNQAWRMLADLGAQLAEHAGGEQPSPRLRAASHLLKAHLLTLFPLHGEASEWDASALDALK